MAACLGGRGRRHGGRSVRRRGRSAGRGGAEALLEMFASRARSGLRMRGVGARAGGARPCYWRGTASTLGRRPQVGRRCGGARHGRRCQGATPARDGGVGRKRTRRWSSATRISGYACYSPRFADGSSSGAKALPRLRWGRRRRRLRAPFPS